LDKEGKRMNALEKRPKTPSESLKESMKQMKLIQEGKLPKKTWQDYLKEQEKEK
jgi:hypothetical protein